MTDDDTTDDTTDDALTLLATGLTLTEVAARLGCGVDDVSAQVTASGRRATGSLFGSDDLRAIQDRKLTIAQRALLQLVLDGDAAAARVYVRTVEVQNELMGLGVRSFLPTAASPEGGDPLDELRLRRANRHERTRAD